ncbi:hypothetical protein ACFL4E_02210 [Candidatus Omnitrophota bacterium]
MRVFHCLLAALLLSFSVTCVASANVIGETDKDVAAIATPALNGMLEGLKTGDYPTYSKDFDVMLRDAISKEQFVKIRTHLNDKFGLCEGKTYLGFMTKGKTTVILWKGRFEKSADDVLISLIMIKKGNKDLVTKLMFQ